MHKHTVFLFVILLLIAANVYGQAIDSLQITHIARTISQETDMFLTESIGKSKELCTFVQTIHHTTTSMNLRLILLYCLLLQFLIPTYGYGKGYFTATRLSPTTYGFTPYYYNKDHLGNIREVVDAGGNLQQRTNYYPFGETHGDCPSVRVKPNTKSGQKAAQKRADLMRKNGYEPKIKFYDPNDPKYLPGSPTYIGPKKN